MDGDLTATTIQYVWVQHFETKFDGTKTHRTQLLSSNTKIFVAEVINQPTINTKKDLQRRIIDIIHNPNETWKSLRQNYIMIE